MLLPARDRGGLDRLHCAQLGMLGINRVVLPAGVIVVRLRPDSCIATFDLWRIPSAEFPRAVQYRPLPGRQSRVLHSRGQLWPARNPPQAESKINSISKVVFFMRSPLNLSSLSVTERRVRGLPLSSC